MGLTMDLSKLLGDLYAADDQADHDDDRADDPATDQGPAGDDRSGGEPAVAVEAPASARSEREASAAPDWSNETRLDQVFASWTPGPPSDAPAAEREIAYSGLADSMDEARLRAEAEPEAGPVMGNAAEAAEPSAGDGLSWSRSDDDVLPYRRDRRRRLSRLRR